MTLRSESSLSVAIKDGQPVVAGTALPVAAVVHACHEKTIDLGLAELAVPGLDRATLADYCDDLTVREVADADHWIVHQKTAEVIGLIGEFLNA